MRNCVSCVAPCKGRYPRYLDLLSCQVNLNPNRAHLPAPNKPLHIHSLVPGAGAIVGSAQLSYERCLYNAMRVFHSKAEDQEYRRLVSSWSHLPRGTCILPQIPLPSVATFGSSYSLLVHSIFADFARIYLPGAGARSCVDGDRTLVRKVYRGQGKKEEGGERGEGGATSA